MTLIFRTRVLLDEILKIHGSRTFGSICQLLLGLTFVDLGFRVLECRLTGRPDLIVQKDVENYAIEVKASVVTEVVIKQEDIDGVVGTEHKAILAILSYPEVETKWIIIDARLVHAGRLNKISLEKYSLNQIESAVSNAFPSTLQKYYETAKKGVRALKVELDKNIFWN